MMQNRPWFETEVQISRFCLIILWSWNTNWISFFCSPNNFFQYVYNWKKKRRKNQMIFKKWSLTVDIGILKWVSEIMIHVFFFSFIQSHNILFTGIVLSLLWMRLYHIPNWTFHHNNLDVFRLIPRYEIFLKFLHVIYLALVYRFFNFLK